MNDHSPALNNPLFASDFLLFNPPPKFFILRPVSLHVGGKCFYFFFFFSK
jgi:hypothetical protein